MINLPPESRFMQRYSPFKDWSWDKEVQVQILHSIDVLSAMYANANRKKGAKPIKPPKLVQPEYVEKAKKQAKEDKKAINQDDQKDLSDIFEKRNSKVKKLEG